MAVVQLAAGNLSPTCQAAASDGGPEPRTSRNNNARGINRRRPTTGMSSTSSLQRAPYAWRPIDKVMAVRGTATVAQQQSTHGGHVLLNNDCGMATAAWQQTY